MNEVFEKARELGEAILRSDEYITMKAIEEKAMQNEVASKAMEMYQDARRKLEEAMKQKTPNVAEMKRLSDELNAYQEKMREITEVTELTRARENFSNLVSQVNQVLKFLITGEIEDEKGCGGGCDRCSSRCRTLH